MINIDSDYNKIYHEYYPVLLRYVGSKRIQHINTEEVAHEVLTRLWVKRKKCNFENDTQLVAWLIRAARFVILEHMRAEKDTESLTDHENVASDTDYIEQHFESARLKEYIREIEQSLSEHDRLVFRMIFIERRPYPECAAELKIKEVSLRASISRLRHRLRPYIDKILEEK